MLAILYIISAATSFWVPILENREDYKKSSRVATIAIICGFLYSIPTIIEIRQNLFDPNLGTVFGLLSLIFWNYAFLSNEGEYCLDYLVAAFLASAVLCFICSNIHFSDYLINCNEEHKKTERIEIVTTVDGLENGESIYGDGFVVALYDCASPNVTFYQYYFRAEDGTLLHKDIRAKHTEITYINANSTPYVEITYKDICKGYRAKSKNHVFFGRLESYHLYIPKNSIQTNINPASN